MTSLNKNSVIFKDAFLQDLLLRCLCFLDQLVHFLFLEKGVFLNYNQFDVSGNIDLTIHFTLFHCFVTEFLTAHLSFCPIHCLLCFEVGLKV